MSIDKKSSQPNEGIIANTVTADVLAVGKGASATKYQIDTQVQKDVIEKLDTVINLINTNSPDKASSKILVNDLAAIKTEVEKGQPDQEKVQTKLSSFGEKFLLVKNTLKDATDVIESVKTIASLLKIPLSFLAF